MPGYRLGAITAGLDLAFQLAKIIDNIQICAPRTVQHALAPMIDRLADWRYQNRQRIATRVTVFRRVLDQLDGWDLLSSGAYFGFVRHPYSGVDSLEVAQLMARRPGYWLFRAHFLAMVRTPCCALLLPMPARCYR